jgi:hypothetical protein
MAVRFNRIVFVSLLALTLTHALHSQDMPAPVGVQFPLLMKVLSFDRSLGTRVGNEVVIGVIYQKSFRISLNAMNDLLSALEDSPIEQVEGIPIRCVPIAINVEGDLAEALSKSGANVVYITPLRSVRIETITSVCQSKRILTLTGVPDYIELGLALGVGTKGEKPLIIINLAAAKAVGADFNAQLLHLAKVIK